METSWRCMRQFLAPQLLIVFLCLASSHAGAGAAAATATSPTPPTAAAAAAADVCQHRIRGQSAMYGQQQTSTAVYLDQVRLAAAAGAGRLAKMNTYYAPDGCITGIKPVYAGAAAVSQLVGLQQGSKERSFVLLEGETINRIDVRYDKRCISYIRWYTNTSRSSSVGSLQPPPGSKTAAVFPPQTTYQLMAFRALLSSEGALGQLQFVWGEVVCMNAAAAAAVVASPATLVAQVGAPNTAAAASETVGGTIGTAQLQAGQHQQQLIEAPPELPVTAVAADTVNAGAGAATAAADAEPLAPNPTWAQQAAADLAASVPPEAAPVLIEAEAPTAAAVPSAVDAAAPEAVQAPAPPSPAASAAAVSDLSRMRLGDPSAGSLSKQAAVAPTPAQAPPVIAPLTGLLAAFVAAAAKAETTQATQHPPPQQTMKNLSNGDTINIPKSKPQNPAAAFLGSIFKGLQPKPSADGSRLGKDNNTSEPASSEQHLADNHNATAAGVAGNDSAGTRLPRKAAGRGPAVGRPGVQVADHTTTHQVQRLSNTSGSTSLAAHSAHSGHSNNLTAEHTGNRQLNQTRGGKRNRQAHPGSTTNANLSDGLPGHPGADRPDTSGLAVSAAGGSANAAVSAQHHQQQHQGQHGRKRQRPHHQQQQQQQHLNDWQQGSQQHTHAAPPGRHTIIYGAAAPPRSNSSAVSIINPDIGWVTDNLVDPSQVIPAVRTASSYADQANAPDTPITRPAAGRHNRHTRLATGPRLLANSTSSSSAGVTGSLAALPAVPNQPMPLRPTASTLAAGSAAPEQQDAAGNSTTNMQPVMTIPGSPNSASGGPVGVGRIPIATNISAEPHGQLQTHTSSNGGVSSVHLKVIGSNVKTPVVALSPISSLALGNVSAASQQSVSRAGSSLEQQAPQQHPSDGTHSLLTPASSAAAADTVDTQPPAASAPAITPDSAAQPLVTTMMPSLFSTGTQVLTNSTGATSVAMLGTTWPATAAAVPQGAAVQQLRSVAGSVSLTSAPAAAAGNQRSSNLRLGQAPGQTQVQEDISTQPLSGQLDPAGLPAAGTSAAADTRMVVAGRVVPLDAVADYQQTVQEPQKVPQLQEQQQPRSGDQAQPQQLDIKQQISALQPEQLEILKQVLQQLGMAAGTNGSARASTAKAAAVTSQTPAAQAKTTQQQNLRHSQPELDDVQQMKPQAGKQQQKHSKQQQAKLDSEALHQPASPQQGAGERISPAPLADAAKQLDGPTAASKSEVKTASVDKPNTTAKEAPAAASKAIQLLSLIAAGAVDAKPQPDTQTAALAAVEDDSQPSKQAAKSQRPSPPVCRPQPDKCNATVNSRSDPSYCPVVSPFSRPQCVGGCCVSSGKCSSSECAASGLGKFLPQMMCQGLGSYGGFGYDPAAEALCKNLACRLAVPGCRTGASSGNCVGKVVALAPAQELHTEGLRILGYPCLEAMPGDMPLQLDGSSSKAGEYVARLWSVCDCQAGDTGAQGLVGQEGNGTNVVQQVLSMLRIAAAGNTAANNSTSADKAGAVLGGGTGGDEGAANPGLSSILDLVLPALNGKADTMSSSLTATAPAPTGSANMRLAGNTPGQPGYSGPGAGDMQGVGQQSSAMNPADTSSAGLAVSDSTETLQPLDAIAEIIRGVGKIATAALGQSGEETKKSASASAGDGNKSTEATSGTPSGGADVAAAAAAAYDVEEDYSGVIRTGRYKGYISSRGMGIGSSDISSSGVGSSGSGSGTGSSDQSSSQGSGAAGLVQPSRTSAATAASTSSTGSGTSLPSSSSSSSTGSAKQRDGPEAHAADLNGNNSGRAPGGLVNASPKSQQYRIASVDADMLLGSAQPDQAQGVVVDAIDSSQTTSNSILQHSIQMPQQTSTSEQYQQMAIEPDVSADKNGSSSGSVDLNQLLIGDQAIAGFEIQDPQLVQADIGTGLNTSMSHDASAGGVTAMNPPAARRLLLLL